VVEHLLSKDEALSSDPSTEKKKTHINTKTEEAKVMAEVVVASKCKAPSSDPSTLKKKEKKKN
jgi:hypothetical protein